MERLFTTENLRNFTGKGSPKVRRQISILELHQSITTTMTMTTDDNGNDDDDHQQRRCASAAQQELRRSVAQSAAVSQKRRAPTTAAKKTPRTGARYRREVSSPGVFDAVSSLVAEAIEVVLSNARDAAAAAADDLPMMRKLRSIEWFAGSGRLSFALRKHHGWNAVIHDRDQDVVEWDEHGEHPKNFRSDEFEELAVSEFWYEKPYDYFHFSIDCRSFSTLGHAGQGRTDTNDFLGEGDRCKEGNRLLNKAIKMISDQLERNKDFLYTIENPFTGKMKDHPMVVHKLEAKVEDGGIGATRCVVDYCCFWSGGDAMQRPFQKRTIFWTNSESLIREFGVYDRGALSNSHFLCERTRPCSYYRHHKPVNGKTSREATPFPQLLAARIACAIDRDASARRWRPLGVKQGIAGGIAGEFPLELS